MTETPPPARKRWWTRLLLVVVQIGVFTTLGAIGVVTGWLRSDDFQDRARELLVQLVEGQSGEVCSVDDVDVRLWPPSVSLERFSLVSKEDGHRLVEVQRARVPLVLRDGGVKLGRVTVVEPRLSLRLDETGQLVDFQDRFRPDPKQAPKPLRELPWSSLEVTNGAFEFLHPEVEVSLGNVQLQPSSNPGLVRTSDLSASIRVHARELDTATQIAWRDVIVGPKAIVIPDLVIESTPLDLRGRVHIPLQGNLDVDLRLHVPLEEINPVLTPPRKAHGELYADLRIEGSMADPVARVNVLAERLGADVPGVFTPLLTYEMGEVSAAAVVHKDRIDIDRATVRIASGQVEAWGQIALPELYLNEGHVTGEDVALRELLMAFDAAPTPWINMRTDLEISCSGSLKPLRLEGVYDMDVSQLRVGDRPIADPAVELMLDIPRAYSTGTLLLEKDHIFMSSQDITGPRTTGAATVDIGFGPRGPLDLRMDLSGADLSDFQPLNGVELSGRGYIAGRIWGPFNALQMEGQGDIENFSVLEMPYADRLRAELASPDMKSIVLSNARASVGQTRYNGDFTFDFAPPLGMYTDIVFEEGGRVEDIVGVFVDIEGMKGNMHGNLSLHGPLYDLDGETHLVLSEIDLWGERFDLGEGHGYMDQGLFTLDDLRVLRNDRQEGILLRGGVGREWAMDMELLADGLALERLTRLEDQDLPLIGNIAAHAHIGGTLFDFEPDGKLTLRDVRYDGFSVDDSVLTFDTTDGVAALGGALMGSAVRVEGSQGLWDLQPYDIELALDDVPVHLLYPKGANGNDIVATTTGRVHLNGHFGEVWSPVALDARLDEVEVRYGHHLLRNIQPWEYAQDGKRFRIKDFGLEGGDTRISLSANGSPGSLLLGGDGQIDLDLLRAVVPGLQRSVGTADLVVYAVGSKPNVEAVVELEVDAELMRHDSVPASFEDVKAKARVTENRIALEAVDASLGGGTFAARGHIDAEEWMPTRWNLRSEVRDAQIQWVESLPPAIGDADLLFDGPVDALLLSGDVQVSDMVFSDRIDWEDWVVEYRDEMLVDSSAIYAEDESTYFDMNVHVMADRTITLRNNVAEGVASADLRIIGDTVRPGLLGRVTVHSGIAFLQDRQFRIDRGEMNFQDPWTWDPDLDFDLVTDIDNLDQRYRVNYQVFGPFSDWRTQTRSDPPLPQSDVNALLWFGATTDQLEEMGELSSAVAQGVADLVLTDFLLTNSQTDSGPQELLFDRLDLATGVNARGEYSSEPRLVVEKRLDEFGSVDLTWEFNLVRPEDNYVSLERRIGGLWSLAGWYATMQRQRVLPIGGAYGVDVTARWESD